MFRMKIVIQWLLLMTVVCFAQLPELTIEGKPVKAQTQIVATSGAGAPMYAAIQVLSDLDGFRYDAYNGVVRVDDQPGKDMVYLRTDERVVEVFLTGYKPLKINLAQLGIQLAPKEIWVITIKAKHITSTVPVQIRYDPPDAILFIDNSAAPRGPVFYLTLDKHRIKINKRGYKTLEEEIVIDRPNMTINRQLVAIPVVTETVAAPFEKYIETEIDTVEQVPKPATPGEETPKELRHATRVATVQTPQMILVKGGTFPMGSVKISNDESPIHFVTLRDFYISKFEITFIEYDAFCNLTKRVKVGDNGWGRGMRPAIRVNWHDAVAYCNWRSQMEGFQQCYNIIGENVSCNFDANGYRLPTEAEWEYAARGGDKSRGFFYSGSDYLDEVTVYHHNSGSQSQPVGSKLPNELGIFDMSGNLWEWCWDWYAKEYYSISPKVNPTGPPPALMIVLRGGSWSDNPRTARITNRFRNYPVTRTSTIGFRMVRSAG